MPDINKAYSWAVNTCNAPNVGYSQAYRNQQTVGGITYYDCSSFINYALLAGGWETPQYAPKHNPFTTGIEINVLLSLGFTDVSSDPEYLPGDIGWTSGHTEMCYKGGTGKGVFMGAHTSNAPLANQVSIGSSKGDSNYERSFPRRFRYGSGGASGYGSSIYVIAAIAGNLRQESNVNPGIWEGLRQGTWTELKHGFGLGQWTNTGGDTHGRLYKLHEWLSSNGYADDSGEGQCQYIVEENVWYSTGEASAYSSLSDFLTSSSTDITHLTHAWNIGWEGIHDSSWDTRVTYAKEAYQYILDHGNDSSITQWITGNRYLNVGEMLNNSVMLYRFFSAGGGGGGTPAKRKVTMPVWMMIRYR